MQLIFDEDNAKLIETSIESEWEWWISAKMKVKHLEWTLSFYNNLV